MQDEPEMMPKISSTYSLSVTLKLLFRSRGRHLIRLLCVCDASKEDVTKVVGRRDVKK